jgi:hypothetical protein
MLETNLHACLCSVQGENIIIIIILVSDIMLEAHRWSLLSHPVMAASISNSLFLFSIFFFFFKIENFICLKSLSAEHISVINFCFFILFLTLLIEHLVAVASSLLILDMFSNILMVVTYLKPKYA